MYEYIYKSRNETYNGKITQPSAADFQTTDAIQSFDDVHHIITALQKRYDAQLMDVRKHYDHELADVRQRYDEQERQLANVRQRYDEQERQLADVRQENQIQRQQIDALTNDCRRTLFQPQNVQKGQITSAITGNRIQEAF